MQIDPYYSSCHVSGTSFWQYKAYADIRKGSLDMRHQMTVGSRVNARAVVAC